MKRPMVVRATKTEFELDNGKTYPIPFLLDEVPTLEEFQKTYDHWFEIFKQEELIDGQTSQRK
jgi:hypothetical protein